MAELTGTAKKIGTESQGQLSLVKGNLVPSLHLKPPRCFFGKRGLGLSGKPGA